METQPAQQIEDPTVSIDESNKTDNSKLASKAALVITICSGVVLVAAGRICDASKNCQNELAFAVAVGVLGSITGAILIALERLPSNKFFGLLKQIFAVFSAVLWTIGACVSTFRSPFTATGNGYFASWVAFAASLYYVHLTVPLFNKILFFLTQKAQSQSTDRKLAMIILLSSSIELVASATVCDQMGSCTHQYGWAVAIGAISIFFSLLFIALHKVVARFSYLFPIILVLLWIPGAGVLTFDAPFVVTGNGYFSAWVSFFYSCYWLIICIPKMKKGPQPEPNGLSDSQV
eukprot:c20144_g3_i1.p1 GENE.c20144_g3_i1~~c20144_g3_i1.p1  ORF type:complete len:298 (+),score=118.02 c20144_g3_i1:23-895(+)